MDLRIVDTFTDSLSGEEQGQSESYHQPCQTLQLAVYGKLTVSSPYHEIRLSSKGFFMVNAPDLKLERIVVVYLGKKRFAVAPKIGSVPLGELSDGELFGGAG